MSSTFGCSASFDKFQQGSLIIQLEKYFFLEEHCNINEVDTSLFSKVITEAVHQVSVFEIILSYTSDLTGHSSNNVSSVSHDTALLAVVTCNERPICKLQAAIKQIHI